MTRLTAVSLLSGLHGQPLQTDDLGAMQLTAPRCGQLPVCFIVCNPVALALSESLQKRLDLDLDKGQLTTSVAFQTDGPVRRFTHRLGRNNTRQPIGRLARLAFLDTRLQNTAFAAEVDAFFANSANGEGVIDVRYWIKDDSACVVVVPSDEWIQALQAQEQNKRFWLSPEWLEPDQTLIFYPARVVGATDQAEPVAIHDASGLLVYWQETTRVCLRGGQLETMRGDATPSFEQVLGEQRVCVREAWSMNRGSHLLALPQLTGVRRWTTPSAPSDSTSPAGPNPTPSQEVPPVNEE